LACMRPDLASAIVAHSGGTHPFDDCVPGPKPVMLLHGTNDGTIDVSCGKEARDRWVQHNGCSVDVDVVTVRGGHCEYNRGCPTAGQVVLCLFDGMGHGWAGHNGIAGGGANYEDATKLAWSF